MKKLLILATILILGVFIISLGGCSSSSSTSTNENTSTASYEDIDGTKLLELLKDSNTVVVDVRELGEYQSGHIDKSILIPLGQLPNQLNQLDKNKTIVVVCASGARSAQAAQFLIDNGFTNVKNLQGGIYGNGKLTLVQ